MRKRILLWIGLVFMLLAGLSAYYIWRYPAEYRTIAPDGTEIMIVCGGEVCKAPIADLPNGLEVDKIVIENRSVVEVVAGSDTSNSIVLVRPGSGAGTGTQPPAAGAEEPVPATDPYAALSVVLYPRPGERVEIHVANRTYYVVYNEEGEVVATNIVDLPGPFAVVAEDAKTAIITYVAAPLIAGLVFTFSTFGLGAGIRRR